MAAANTYTPIFTTTLSSTASSVTFSSIPSTYTDLILVCNPLSTSGDTYIQFNGDTATNYSSTVLYGNAVPAIGSTRTSSDSKIYLDWQATSTTTGATSYIVSINNYANTTTYKTTLGRGNQPSAGVDVIVGLWRSTSAINSIKITAVGTLQIGTTYSLYGILAA
jgi:hypothetical protein